MSDTEYQGRGSVTERVKAKSIELLGYKITTEELRFMAYLQFCLMNEQSLDRTKMSDDEIGIFINWSKREWLYSHGPTQKLRPRKDFWDAMCAILYLGYVDLSE
jgi:hypothetical protein